MKKVVLHPDYAFYLNFINRLPEVFHTEGKTIFKERNEVKIFMHQGLEFVVKSFKIPHFINQFAYSTLRASKAERAYRHALILLDKGIMTPIPIAYIEIKKFGLLFNSYFISTKSRFNRELRELSEMPKQPETYLGITDFARFTAGLHQMGIYHKDYSSRNILFGQIGGHFEFELLDLNRMKFCEINLKDGSKNLSRICFTDDMYRFFAKAYAVAKGFDAEACEAMLLKYRRKK